MNRPQLKQSELIHRLDVGNFLPLLKEYPCYIVGIRGYFKDTMGVPGENDINLYDDGMFLVGPGYFNSFNGNTDPSKHKPGIASLVPGFYLYKQGMHGVSGPNPYPAFRQYSNVTILRDGKTEPQTDSPANRFWIDIHRGGYSTTSSLGCQTIHPDQWPDFKKTGYNLMDEHNQSIIPYILMEA